ncbi:cbb3-type cytochrome oxidase assembly protein CcoS [Roseimaritima ulvae]|uniref:Cytochrome oxidase maturation protein cbb3-type n=1 Tax=Roseimaritima ulvae TaxID=980254 RepID=A0A5B9QNP7_9BACT|nr:cbb3-type cytochrome oxidase assembly protein CcoS [Roseimaritima ulvae]QEG39569.1 Cytochrome oxidase maturation protein cbb3-type [Roseimaritima ulvae]
MSVLYIALPLALLLGGGGMLACVYCIRNGQYEDLDTPAIRILVDERPTEDANDAEDAAETA